MSCICGCHAGLAAASAGKDEKSLVLLLAQPTGDSTEKGFRLD